MSLWPDASSSFGSWNIFLTDISERSLVNIALLQWSESHSAGINIIIHWWHIPIFITEYLFSRQSYVTMVSQWVELNYLWLSLKRKQSRSVPHVSVLLYQWGSPMFHSLVISMSVPHVSQSCYINEHPPCFTVLLYQWASPMFHSLVISMSFPHVSQSCYINECPPCFIHTNIMAFKNKQLYWIDLDKPETISNPPHVQ